MTHREKLLEQLRETLLSLMPKAEHRDSRIASVTMSRANTPQPCSQCIYQPVLVLVVQGTKQSVIGGTTANYRTGQTTVVALDMPGVYEITEATEAAPFLSIAVQLDRKILTELLTTIPELAAPKESSGKTGVKAVMTADATEEMLEAFLKLISLEKTPERIPVFAPLLLKELHYLALTSNQGVCLRSFFSGESHAPRIARSVAWLRNHYREPLTIESLALRAAMSASSFHKHFKELTTLSPVQFQKRLRLQEAARLMLSEGKNVEAAAFAVGYKSSSQFSREYKRVFGVAPHGDISRKRAALAA